ncbi:MAG: chromosome segregation protein SMC [Phycisphaerae bacterium]|nr:chromosome segregation protein SMC [Phycisphaerae bacterium]
MFLKRITVAGFKSFCDRVDFDFGPGITCIVGPNGCGKSNVVDAFKWVLGEQSARSLRGRQMLDMIFNGSSSRKSSSVAQVDLVFDNRDHTLPVDHEEVTVSRKLYRSGESEYLLNQQPTRLKDVRELFLDTGVGVESYSVIEQGRVDGLLQSSPADRRAIFDEASGISKYKARRKEAERKLERAEQNLLRVADIIEEVERRLRSVKIQAAKARNYREYEQRLNELRSAYAMAEFHRFTLELQRLAGEVADAEDRTTGLRADIDRRETESLTASARLDELMQEISRTEAELVAGKSSLAAQQERVESARRRREELAGQLEQTEQRREADARRIAQQQGDIVAARMLLSDLESESERIRGRIAEADEQDRAHARTLSQAQAVLEDEKSGIIELVRRSAQTHNEIIRLNTHHDSLVGQQGRLQERDVQIRSELEELLQRKSALEHRSREVEGLIEEQTRRLEEKKIAAHHARELVGRLAEELAESKERRSALTSRREVLEDLERNMEGVGAGVRRILDEKLQSADSSTLDWAAGLVADVFQTDVSHARIIESALGDWDQYLVVRESGAFLSYMAGHGEPPGRLTAHCLDLLPPIINDPQSYDNREGFVCRAIDLVRFHADFEPLARHLLGRTIVVERLDHALALAREDITGHRFVTLSGELVEPDGRIAVGPPTTAAGLISRKSELRDIELQLAILAERITSLADQLERARTELDHLDGVQQELRTAIYELSTAKVEATTAQEKIGESVTRLTEEQPLIAHETQMLEQQIRETMERSQQSGRSLEAIERENAEQEARIAEHQNRIDSIVAARREIQDRLTTARVEAGQIAERQSGAKERIAALERSLRELENALAAATQEIESCRQRMTEAESTATAGAEQIARLQADVERLEDTIQRLRRQRDDLRLEMDARAHEIRNTRAALATAEAELHERQLSLGQTTVRRDDLVTRVREEMSIDLAERYAEYEHTEQDWAEVEAEINELRQKMSRLGNVNLDAITELEELEQRHGFLATQRDDLVESRRQLQQLIERLNEESKDRFESAFNQIREHFRAMFRKLFGGGKADIVLENPESMLESGIEIVAQPPGKDLQVISLMSGGEKSLTAIALLMSIFKIRPAPFAIMDEVDAALDEANNERFNRIVREFCSESQFIVISHSKWTMNIADRLYGITMQEPGVSTRVSVELAKAAVA